MKRYFFLLILFLPLTSPVQCADWVMVGDDDGIQVYVQDTADQDIKKVKARTEIDTSLKELSDYLNGFDNYKEWLPYLKESRPLKQFGPNEWLIYSYFDAPWPVRDRDYVYRAQVEYGDGIVSYQMQTEESVLMPEQQGVVRAVLIESRYLLTAIGEHRTRMEVIFHTDPRGQLPLWIVNIVHKKIPFDGLRNLRNHFLKAKKLN